MPGCAEAEFLGMDLTTLAHTGLRTLFHIEKVTQRNNPT